MIRYNGYPAVRIAGYPNLGVSSGAAMAEMEQLASQLPKGFAVEWTGVSLQEKQAGSQTTILMAFSMLVVFLVLAALYESWAIPLSVILVVPLGLIGAFAAIILRQLASDVFFQVGLITIIGLSAKNAILIVEFAKQYVEEGKDVVEAAVEAAKVRLRPILMTSLAFTLGIVPLMIAAGASAETQHAIGTGVFGGMITGTVLAIFLVPAFFVVVVRLAARLRGKRAEETVATPTRLDYDGSQISPRRASPAALGRRLLDEPPSEHPGTSCCCDLSGSDRSRRGYLGRHPVARHVR